MYMPQRKFASTNQKHFPDLRNDPSLERNFCAHSPGLILQWYQWWSCEMSAVFSGYIALWQLPDQCTLDHRWCQNVKDQTTGQHAEGKVAHWCYYYIHVTSSSHWARKCERTCGFTLKMWLMRLCTWIESEKALLVPVSTKGITDSKQYLYLIQRFYYFTIA